MSVACAAAVLYLIGLPAEPPDERPTLVHTPVATPVAVQASRLTLPSAPLRISEKSTRNVAARITRRMPAAASTPASDAAPEPERQNQAAVPSGTDAVSRFATSESRLTVAVVCELEDPPFGLAADALQQCIDNAPPSASVEIPRGFYLLRRQVVIRRPITIRTAGSADGSITCSSGPDGCANLVASPGLLDDNGVLSIQSTSDVTLEHIVLDGNRSARLSTSAVQACRSGRNTAGFTASVIGCVRCRLRDVVATHALCGTGMLWVGAEAVIEYSDFRDNGDSATRMWADGLTAVYAPDSHIRDNRFIENSDVGLILGYAARSRVERNHLVQRQQSVFAGFMLDNFNSDDLTIRGDFRDLEMTDNVIDCRQLRCLYGIQIGPGPWYPTRNIIGGHIWDNQVHGAKVGINVDGAGTPQVPVQVFSNRVTDLPPLSYFSNCEKPTLTGWMNIAPRSFVDRGDDATPTGAYLADFCQFFSPLVPLVD